MARDITAKQFFGLDYLRGGDLTPERVKAEAIRKLPKTGRNLSPQAANAQTSNATNRARKTGKETKRG